MVEREGEDYGYAAFYNSIDSIVSGKARQPGGSPHETHPWQ